MADQPQQRRKILQEEEFSATLTSIVQRDYFPELPQLERQAAVLERRSQGDVVGAVAVRRAVRRLKQHEETIAAHAEEDEHDLQDDHQVRRRARPLHHESITGFHSRVTNEDDGEFDSNQKKEVKANRERLEKLFRANEVHKVRLLTMASDKFDAEPNRIAASEWKRPAVRNGFFCNPTPLRLGSQQDNSTDATLLIKDKSTVAEQLALMPPPAIISKKDKAIPKHELVEYVPKHMLEKKIEPSQTRFPNQIVPFPSRTIVAAPSMSEDWSETDDGSTTDISTDLDAPVKPVEQERHRRRQRQDRNQQSYVAMTPLLVPGVGNESPITTWGTVDSTPMVLSGQEPGNDKKSSSFAVASENGRERAARKAEGELARRAKRAKTAKQSTKAKSAPVAASMYDKTKLTSSRTRDSFASSLRSSYTPKVRSKSSSGSSHRRPGDSAYNTTPLASRTQITKQK